MWRAASAPRVPLARTSIVANGLFLRHTIAQPVSALVSSAAASPSPCACCCRCQHRARALHTTAALGVTFHTRKRGSTAAAAAAAAAEAAAAEHAAAEAEAQRIASLRAVAAHEAELEAAAFQAAEEGGAYRRPHVKKRGKTREARQAALAAAEAAEAEAAAAAVEAGRHDVDEDDDAAVQAEIDALYAKLTPEERARVEHMMREHEAAQQPTEEATASEMDEAIEEEADEEGMDENDEKYDDDEDIDDDEDEPAYKTVDPAERERKRLARKAAAAARVREAEASVRSASEAPSPEDEIAAPLVAHVEEQLRRLEDASRGSSSKSSLSSGGGHLGSIGFDTIDLSHASISEEEVFESVQVTAGMRKLQEQARKGDSQKRMMVQRIERVTEKTKEIIGRVLLEESVRIAAIQANAQQRRPHTPKSSAAARADPSQWIDLRTTPTFRIHQVRYSTDLRWANVMWTLGKDGYHVPENPDAAELYPSRKRAAASAAAAASSTSHLPNWFDVKRRIALTLEHVSAGLRGVLGRELDIKYTPAVRFAYDDLYDLQQTRLRAEREHRRQQAETEAEDARYEQIDMDELRRLTHSHDPAVSQGAQRALHRRQNDQAYAAGGMFDAPADEFTPEQMRADQEADARFGEERHFYIPKRKLKAYAEREKARIAKREAKEKRKALLAQIRAETEGVSRKEQPPPPPETTDPAVLRAHLQSEMARLARAKKPERPENMAMLEETRVAWNQLREVQALAKKATINPVEVMREKRLKQAMPHYPANWREQTEKYWKKTDGRTRQKFR